MTLQQVAADSAVFWLLAALILMLSAGACFQLRKLTLLHAEMRPQIRDAILSKVYRLRQASHRTALVVALGGTLLALLRI